MLHPPLISRHMRRYTHRMGKLLVDVDREALERVRVKLGARSHAEALRKLIETADVAQDPGYVFRLEQGRAALADTSRAKVKDPGMDKPLKRHFRPNPKPGKK